MGENFRKFSIVAITAGVIGFAAGNAFWYLASPLWIDVEVSETVTQAQVEATLAGWRVFGCGPAPSRPGQRDNFSRG